MRDRQHPRRLGRHRPPVVHHAEPAESVTDPSLSVSRETPPVEEQARLALLAASEEPLRPLTKDRVAALEALTAVWMREVRIGGPGPEDTLLYAAPKPPPPPPREEPAPDDPWAPVDEVTELTPELAAVRHVPEFTAGELTAVATVLEQEPLEQTSPRVVRDWSSRHDERSKAFDVSDRLAGRAPLADKLWPIGPVFDQGTTPPLSLHDASGCVGMAVTAAANVLARSADLATTIGLLSKDDALGLYARAQQLDQVSGEAYAGTSVLAGMKAGQEAGLWSDYLWAFGTRPLAQALMQVGPAVIGIPWFTGMEEPDAAGVIRPTGQAAGGHSMALVGLLVSKPGGPWFVAQQSRGPSVGDGGRVLIHHKDLARLLAGVGEAAIPVPPGGVR